jgi:hypothetical protein
VIGHICSYSTDTTQFTMIFRRKCMYGLEVC